ncbi:MAG TPA: bifunctional precorrin-2 dehydrogenase/sirohydrochlorin ferrochelatase [Candidatus Angelobacter sp.]|jgi:precorrin-2 dehydrogenase/sirohydrochlorin ferrochelatase|nr:bifunctional precorrin-2 dehydrogenase/sirohydrochlorin ferrochelatase [Candidatus Angelobacter sp.]
MSLYPIFLKLEGHKVLIVGGGLIAEQKIEAVLRSATDVTVVSPQITPRIRLWAHQGRIKYIGLNFRPGMTRGCFLVIAATDSEETNRAVYQEARESGALANAVDDPGYCDFYAPAVVSRGDFQIAVSTGGNSPALSQQVRKQLEQDFGPEYETWMAWLGRIREMMRKVLPRSDRRKELLMLLALCKPKRLSKQNQTLGGNHGPFEKSRAGSQIEACVERASA